jgi:hypothetical protein
VSEHWAVQSASGTWTTASFAQRILCAICICWNEEIYFTRPTKDICFLSDCNSGYAQSMQRETVSRLCYAFCLAAVVAALHSGFYTMQDTVVVE